MKKNTKAAPRKSGTLNRLFKAFENSQPVAESDLNAIETAHYLRLDAVRRGDADAVQFESVAHILNRTVILCEMGFGPESMPGVLCALHEFVDRLAVGIASGEWTIDEALHRRLCATFDIHHQQLRLATRAEVIAAEEEVKQRMDAGDTIDPRVHRPGSRPGKRPDSQPG